MPHLPVTLSVEDAATVLNVTPQTVRKWAAADPPRVTAKKVGRAWIVTLPETSYNAAVVALAGMRTAQAVLSRGSNGRALSATTLGQIARTTVAELIGTLPQCGEDLRERMIAAAGEVVG